MMKPITHRHFLETLAVVVGVALFALVQWVAYVLGRLS